MKSKSDEAKRQKLYRQRKLAGTTALQTRHQQRLQRPDIFDVAARQHKALILLLNKPRNNEVICFGADALLAYTQYWTQD